MGSIRTSQSLGLKSLKSIEQLQVQVANVVANGRMVPIYRLYIQTSAIRFRTIVKYKKTKT